MSSIYSKKESTSSRRSRRPSEKILYSQFESESTEDLTIDFAIDTEFSPSIQHSDYVSTRENYVLFHVRFTSVEYGFFKDLISIHAPVKDVIERYSKFFPTFSAFEELEILVGPKIGVETQKSSGDNILSHKKNKKRGSAKDKLFANSSFAEQNITSSHLLIISAPSEAKFNRELLRAYIDSKSEQTQFVERWLPAVQGAVPLSEDTACVVAASLHTLNGKQSPSVRASPRDFVHRAVPLSKLAGTKIERVLEDIKLESVESIRKLCVDAILSNYLSAAIVFSVAHSTGGGIAIEQDVYFVISSESVMLIKKSDLSQIISYIQLADIKSWKHNINTLNIEHVNRFESSTTSSHLIIKSRDSAIISTTLSAVGHSLIPQS